NNYSATLVGWYVNNPNVTDRTLGAGGMEYGTFAAIARDSLDYARGWSIEGDSPSDALCNGLLSSDELAHPNESDILIYPNPTQNRVIINAPPSALERVAILNSQGKDVTSKTTMRDKSNGEKEIDLRLLNAGIYFVRTATATEIVVKR
ncbi:MAG: T9SS type A sorting domain-containing protein, partial [Flavobacteriales bacterium]|nr:T9SS type A sorting domain-containing protein [Flavobacteriales bacterium]